MEGHTVPTLVRPIMHKFYSPTCECNVDCIINNRREKDNDDDNDNDGDERGVTNVRLCNPKVKNNADMERRTETGLVMGHAYGVTDIRKVRGCSLDQLEDRAVFK